MEERRRQFSLFIGQSSYRVYSSYNHESNLANKTAAGHMASVSNNGFVYVFFRTL